MDSINWTHYFAAIFVLAGLLGVMGLAAYAIRQGWIAQGLSGLRRGDAPERRLAVTESLVIDPSRRVVIVRCDEEEHVILIGSQRETVLQTGSAPKRPVAPQDRAAP